MSFNFGFKGLSRVRQADVSRGVVPEEGPATTKQNKTKNPKKDWPVSNMQWNIRQISISYIGVTLVGIQPGTKAHSLSEHISGAASQTPRVEPTQSFPARAEPCNSAAEHSHQTHQGQEEREWLL